jgi:glutathione S-transferase
MGEAWGLPSPSPFCMKLAVWLRLAKVPHQLRSIGGPPRSKSGKLPYIERADGTLMSDSSHIIAQLTQEWSVTLDAHLTPAQLARNLLLQRFIEENLYWVIVYERWAIPEGWKLTKRAYFGGLPPILRDVLPAWIRRAALRDAWGQGLARLPYAQVVERATRDLHAIASTLGDDPFFGGAEPTSIDATAYAFLANLLLAPVPSETRERLSEIPALVSYVARMRERV